MSDFQYFLTLARGFAPAVPVDLRLDRIEGFRALDRTFIETAEISLDAFVRTVETDPKSVR